MKPMRSSMPCRGRAVLPALFVVPLLFSGARARGAADEALREGERPPEIEVVFVLDTTGSMGGLIEGAKRKIWSIANDIADTEPTPQIRFGLVGFRDRGDEYVTRRFDLTDDLDLIYTELMNFTANGGGDGPESVNQALHEAVEKIQWSPRDDVLKIIFLVGDSPPHMDYQDDVPFPDTCRAAVERNLIINTLQCGGNRETTEIWKKIASRAEGEYAAIPQDGGTVAVTTPFDEEIDALSTRLNATVIPFGDAEAQSLARRKVAAAESAPVEAGASRSAFFAKVGRDAGAGGPGAAVVISGSEDLVAQIADGRVKLDSVAKADLPEELRELSKEELESHVDEQLAARREAQGRLDELARRRADFLADAEKEAAGRQGPDAFDRKVREMLGSQRAALEAGRVRPSDEEASQPDEEGSGE